MQERWRSRAQHRASSPRTLLAADARPATRVGRADALLVFLQHHDDATIHRGGDGVWRMGAAPRPQAHGEVVRGCPRSVGTSTQEAA
jgi:hypothetical protein